MKLNRIQYEFKMMGWQYDIHMDNYFCLSGFNGSGKTLMLKTAHALLESVLSGSFNPLINIIREEVEQGFYGSKTLKWHYFFDDVRVEYDNGRYAFIKATDPEHGEFLVSLNGEESMLPKVAPTDFTSFIPFLNDERWSDYGTTMGVLLQNNKGELPKEFIDKLCKGFLDIEAKPKYFEPMPQQEGYRSTKLWYNALDKWLDPFSHGEKEMMCLGLALKAAKRGSGILFIDDFGAGIHLCSQEEIAKNIPNLSEDVQIIYSTHHPSMIPDMHDELHYIDLWDLQDKEMKC